MACLGAEEEAAGIAWRRSQRLKELYEFGPFRVDAEKETLLRAGEPVTLTPKTFQILLVLVRHSQEIVTKDDLLKTVWPDTFVEEANLSRNIFMLRKALGESPQDHKYILTVPGRGYRLAENVRLVANQEFSVGCCASPEGRGAGHREAITEGGRLRWPRFCDRGCGGCMAVFPASAGVERKGHGRAGGVCEFDGRQGF